MLGKSNLPTSHTLLIGRDDDIAKVIDLLNSDAVRLLTLTGLGGIGKTSLALHIAHLVNDAFDDGVFFVNLAPLTQSSAIPLEIAHALQIRQEAEKSLVTSIYSQLADKNILLVLDNIEHIMDGVMYVSDLLQNLPALKIIVTSREALRLHAEQVYPVPPLSNECAVKLFMQRARSVQPAFSFSEEDHHAMVQLCDRLDRLPLAVELAALRTKLFKPKHLLDRLKPDLEPASHLLNLFSSGPRDLPERQQSLRKMIAWSYGLLEEQEKLTLRYASIFPASLSNQMLAELLGKSEFEVLSLVESLVDKNLLKASFTDNETTRFFMLESIREFAWDEIRAEGELPAMKAAYVQLYQQLAAKAEKGLQGKDQEKWLGILDTEYPNLNLAMEIGMNSSAGSTLWRKSFWILTHLEQYWMIHAYFNELIVLAERALQAIKDVNAVDDDLTALKACVYSMMGTAAWLKVDIENAHDYHQRGFELFEKLGDQEKIAFSVNNIAVNADNRGEHDKALALYERSLALYEALDNNWGQTRLHLNIGNHYNLVRHNAEKAFEHAQKSLEFAEELGEPFLLAVASFTYADALSQRGDMQQARSRNQQALKLARQYNFLQTLYWALGADAIFDIMQDDIKSATEKIQEGAQLSLEQNDRGAILGYAQLAAWLAVKQADHAHALYFLSATDKLERNFGIYYHIPDWDRFSADKETLQKELGDETYSTQWDKGQADAPEDVVVSIIQFCVLVEKQISPNPLLEALTAREQEVLALLVAGKSNDEIAEEFVVVLKTAEKHVSNVLRKLGVKNRFAAVQWATENDIFNDKHEASRIS